MIQTICTIISSLFLVIIVNLLVTEGIHGLLSEIIRILKKLPLLSHLLDMFIRNEAKNAVKLLSGPSMSKSSGKGKTSVSIPQMGRNAEDIIEEVKEMRKSELNPDNGRSFAYTYTNDRNMTQLSELLLTAYNTMTDFSNCPTVPIKQLCQEVYGQYMHTNALNPTMFPSLRKFEIEIISMTANMCHGDESVVGSVTSGGTESILMAIKTYRDLARHKRPNFDFLTIGSGVGQLCRAPTRVPNIVIPITGHPAFNKAAHYFSVEIRSVPVDPVTFKVDLVQYRKMITADTILLVASAPSYPHGVIDPIAEIANMALEFGIPLHVDACFGGFILPWLEIVTEKENLIKPWDFRVNGVTSISADVHKYGYCSKGVSVVMYKSEDIRQYQFFAYSLWPGGLFASPSMAGSRPGGLLAQGWAVLQHVGVNGYIDWTRKLWETTRKLCDEVNAIDGLKVLVNPESCMVAIASIDPINIYEVADALEKISVEVGGVSKGWKMERQQDPPCLHCSILPHHTDDDVMLDFVRELKLAVESVKKNKGSAASSTAAMYGMVTSVPNKSLVDDFLTQFLSQIFQ